MRAETRTYLIKPGSRGAFRGECLTEAELRRLSFGCKLLLVASPDGCRFWVVFELKALVGRRYECCWVSLLFRGLSLSVLILRWISFSSLLYY